MLNLKETLQLMPRLFHEQDVKRSPKGGSQINLICMSIGMKIILPTKIQVSCKGPVSPRKNIMSSLMINNIKLQLDTRLFNGPHKSLTIKSWLTKIYLDLNILCLQELMMEKECDSPIADNISHGTQCH